jgi:hypothetical protein
MMRMMSNMMDGIIILAITTVNMSMTSRLRIKVGDRDFVTWWEGQLNWHIFVGLHFFAHITKNRLLLL